MRDYLASQEMESLMVFRLAYLRLTLGHSKGHGHDHAHFD